MVKASSMLLAFCLPPLKCPLLFSDVEKYSTCLVCSFHISPWWWQSCIRSYSTLLPPFIPTTLRILHEKQDVQQSLKAGHLSSQNCELRAEVLSGSLNWSHHIMFYTEHDINSPGTIHIDFEIELLEPQISQNPLTKPESCHEVELSQVGNFSSPCLSYKTTEFEKQMSTSWTSGHG